MTPPSPASDSQLAMADRRAHTVYECSSCGERFVGMRRCPECNLFMQALGVGGVCIHCDEPLLVAELLDDRSATLLG
jgi:DNA-directed RNA polymerase subunit M/transcription elongation factor TFIIS